MDDKVPFVVTANQSDDLEQGAGAAGPEVQAQVIVGVVGRESVPNGVFDVVDLDAMSQRRGWMSTQQYRTTKREVWSPRSGAPPCSY